MTVRNKKHTAKPQELNLALQGGGSHGAFTWGVLDALLEEGVYRFEGISGTSAGAMNATVLAAGFAKAADLHIPDEQEALAKGSELARQTLRNFWEAVGTLGAFLTASPSHLAAQWMPWLKPLMSSSPLSPAQTNPMDINPLRSLLRQQVDFDLIKQYQGGGLVPRLFIGATNVRTGRSKVFESDDLGLDALMASACLPQIFNAVEIDGEHYWDGGYSGNPAIYPLIYRTRADDVLLVQINPIETESVPKTMPEILERINEVTFNASLLSELRAIEFVRRLLDEGRLDASQYKSMRMHRIDGGAFLQTFGSDSKLRSDIGFLQKLFARGRESAQQWLQQHREDIGVRSTL
ncbi:patatin-like phospholipase family protein [Lampropedia puyangensis]|uniref:Patatin-like phospholipase family protein n=1 Tax=Lampropedia puyangensis TaxID=1330072 RepID=A0A4S8F4M2_9BURK|nr:patatin-like phospholipase family protein [Lampropedia puyangensis]THU01979.1 patatin-like phospholipase family protein [Lampropedia puyangensis]